MLSKEASSTIFWVFGMTRPGIEPRSPGPLANTLTPRPMSGIKARIIRTNHIKARIIKTNHNKTRIIKTNHITRKIRTNHIKARIDKTQQNSRCRLRVDRNEMINDIISEWRKLAQKEYKTRHECVGKVIHWELCKKLKFDHTNQWET